MDLGEANAAIAEPAAAAARGWHWHSTPASADAGEISVLAIVETLAAISVYAWVAYRFGPLHLTLAVLVAPILLLRTPASTRLAIDFWQSLLMTKLEVLVPTFLVAFIGAIIVSASMATRAPTLISQLSDAPTESVGVLTMVLIAANVVFGLTVIIPTSTIRTVATLVASVRSPWKAISAVPRNWYRIVACVDVSYPPELLPGATALGNSDAADTLLPVRWLRILPGGRAATFLFGIMVALACLPAMLYRWSLKGTAIVFFPCAYFVWDAPRSKPEFIVGSIAAKGAFAASCAILTVAFAAALKHFFGITIAPLNWYGDLLSSATTPIASALFPADHTATWQVLVVLDAAIVFAGFLYADRLKSRGYSQQQTRLLEIGYAILGIGLVATVASVISLLVLLSIRSRAAGIP